jgi:hypothetical protein
MPYIDKEKQKEYMRQYGYTRQIVDKDKIALRKKNYRLNNKEKVLNQQKSSYQKYKDKILTNPKRKLYDYKKSAQDRGYDFNLPVEMFNELLISNCYYCGKEHCNGVDRKNNEIGYYIENVVPCCKICNFMKRDLSFKDFEEHLKKILIHISLYKK